MRKRYFGRQFKRDINQRKALFRNLMRELILRERIKTTEAKAKSIKGEVERHVTKAKQLGEGARVHLQKHFNQDVIDKLINDLGPRFANRPGGYTRIVKMGNRVKDNAPMVYIEWVEKSTVVTVIEPKKRKDKQTAEMKTALAKVEAKTPVKEEKTKKTVKKEKTTKR